MRISDWSSDVCSSDLVARHPERRRLVGIDIGIAPDHVRCKAARCLIVGQIVRQHADGREAVGELEADHRIAQLPLAELLDIVLRTVRAASGATEAGHASDEDEALQLKQRTEERRVGKEWVNVEISVVDVTLKKKNKNK